MLRVAAPAFALALQAPAPPPSAPPTAPQATTKAFRQWMDGLEVGGAEQHTSREGTSEQHRQRAWVTLSRMGITVQQEELELARRHADGSLTFTWRLQLATEPLEGEARWSPAHPDQLEVRPKGGDPKAVPVPEGALLWPPDQEAKLREAARLRQPVKTLTYTFAVQQWSTLELSPMGPDPLPGHPDAIRFRGQETEGTQAMASEVWISPTEGELRHRTNLGGVEVLTQVADLPAPSATGLKENLFARTLKPIPFHAFLPWLPALAVRQEGGDPVTLAKGPEAEALGPGRWRLHRAAPPTAAEAAELPVTGTPTAEEVRYLAPSPLVPFKDSAFDGLLRRLAPRPGASRWELARAVNRFVFDWITEKDYGVGFATALEVARVPRGDCTEHGVLAVALLRKLGVPARGAVGWVALDDVLGPHFWVEVKLGTRWIPLDPTFDQTPASTFRLKLGDTDLADLGSVGWEGVQVLGPAQWIPTLPDPRIEGDRLTAPDGTRLRWPKGRWVWASGRLVLLTGEGRLELAAEGRPTEAQLRDARKLQVAGGRQGWWTPGRSLHLELGDGRWLKVEGLRESEAFAFLQGLIVELARPQ